MRLLNFTKVITFLSRKLTNSKEPSERIKIRGHRSFIGGGTSEAWYGHGMFRTATWAVVHVFLGKGGCSGIHPRDSPGEMMWS